MGCFLNSIPEPTHRCLALVYHS